MDQETYSPTSHSVDSLGIRLNVLALGDPGRPPIILLHGLRDTAWALLPLAQTLAKGRYVLMPELRGHGRSDHSDAYAIPHFIVDLHNVVEHFSLTSMALFGHSLGGHITARYAALFPDAVRALILAEGMGPPNRNESASPEAELARYKDMLLTRLGQLPASRQRTLSTASVVERLLANNPRLAQDTAELIAPHLLTTGDNPTWAFDTRTNSVFIGNSRDQDEMFWRAVRAPTCVISGALSFEYWGKQLSGFGDTYTGRFAEGEMETRAAHVKSHEHHWFANSGHMIHYDEPERLAQVVTTFLEKHYG